MKIHMQFEPDGPWIDVTSNVISFIQWKRCASETCAERFVAQSRRSDAVYCSTVCAKAQAQRAYRRRKSVDGENGS